eukprot:CAMPEP_0114495782 /NCGR_PEP_ID=MMETSP0109-20121206/5407_1 /TAXON_ID=29199 /ORGANISM="Chlorarachnion reptans, Strain CCCM449" /LENGTH=133 /DNA_ID=CAMNT_0001672985 /DNA_START=81 /DNA_END=482 /DNA_ORIENTATION=+
MVQGGKKRVKSLGKKNKKGPRGKVNPLKRKVGAPKRGVQVVKYKSKKDKKISVAINRNIEEIMASRFISEGGRLNVVNTPKNVSGFVKSGPSFGRKAKGGFSRAGRQKTKDRRILDEQLRKLEAESKSKKEKK